MSDERNDAFVPIRDAEGNVGGLMDRATADYLASHAPDPTQTSLDALLAGVSRVRVVPFANFVQGAAEHKVFLDTSNPESLISFRNCFAIREDPDTFGHCMCCGDPHIELYGADRLIATLGYHHGFGIRWDVWKHDTQLREQERLLDWMSAHGVHGPREEVEDAKRRAEESDRRVEQWLSAMPECVRPFWEQMDRDRDPELQRQLLEAHCTALPGEVSQVLALFGWFEAGAGPWSGYPSYESVPGLLLLHYPTQFLTDVLTATSPSEVEWVGAARYFANWDFRQTKKREVPLLPAVLKQQLLEAARKTGISDNVQRAQNAYGT